VRAVLYDAPASFRIADLPTPAPAPGQVLIKVIQVGVCGTDLHVHHGDFNARFPLVPGHEAVGTIAALGAGVDRFQLGEPVTINPNISCGRCSYCLSGRVSLCQNAKGAGSTSPGFFAEYTCVSELLVFSVLGLPLDTAVFVEPTACAMHGVETLQIRPGATALVIGAGPTGLLLAQLIASSGASSVTVADRVDFKLTTATELGATRTILVPPGAPEETSDILRSDSDGYDIVVEATGSTAVGNLCVPLARNGGTVLIYGVTRADEIINIHPFDVFRREITVKGSFSEMTSFGAAIAALRAGRVRTDGIISHRFDLADYGQALTTMTGDPTAHKVIITV
jgi:D-arabinitol dehydrogenase (NADP+)